MSSEIDFDEEFDLDDLEGDLAEVDRIVDKATNNKSGKEPEASVTVSEPLAKQKNEINQQPEPHKAIIEDKGISMNSLAKFSLMGIGVAGVLFVGITLGGSNVSAVLGGNDEQFSGGSEQAVPFNANTATSMQVNQIQQRYQDPSVNSPVSFNTQSINQHPNQSVNNNFQGNIGQVIEREQPLYAQSQDITDQTSRHYFDERARDEASTRILPKESRQHNDPRDSKLLNLEAQVAMLNLELTKQKNESYSAMRVSGEAARAVIAVRQMVKEMQTDLSGFREGLESNQKAIGRIETTVNTLKATVDQAKVEKQAPKPSRTAKSTERKKESKSSISKPKPEIENYRRLAIFEPIMVTGNGAYILNVGNGDRRVLEINKKYSDLGRITKTDEKSLRIYGISPEGEKWVIYKSEGLM